MKTIIAAILYLAPHLSPGAAGLYARLVDHESTQAGIHPFLVVAHVQMESGWNYQAQGKTADHGLGQVHVSSTSHPELLGHEYLLYDPVINLHLTVKLMKFWRKWHYDRCFPRQRHPWWSHMGWGRKVRDGGKSGRKREEVYRRLLRKFDGDELSKANEPGEAWSNRRGGPRLCRFRKLHTALF